MQPPAGSRLGWPTILGLAVTLAGPPLLAALLSRTGSNPGAARLLAQQGIFCTLAVIIVLLVKYGERRPLQSIGLRRPDRSTIWTALLLFVAGLVLQWLTAPAVRAWAEPDVSAGIAPLVAWPAWFRVVAAVTGGIVEETLYRGYAIERLTMATGRTWLGATLATLVFAAAHVPEWGFTFALIADLPAGILLAGFYVWRRDLTANMVAHGAALMLAMFTMVPPTAI